MLLTKLMDRYNRLRHTEHYTFIKRLSPVAWRHINLRGNFQFRDSQSVDLDKIIIKLVKMTISKYATGNEESFI